MAGCALTDVNHEGDFWHTTFRSGTLESSDGKIYGGTSVLTYSTSDMHTKDNLAKGSGLSPSWTLASASVGEEMRYYDEMRGGDGVPGEMQRRRRQPY